MDFEGSLGFHQPPGDAERERIRELSRYYCALDRPLALDPSAEGERSQDGAPQQDEQPKACDISADITLNALAQLGTHRLRCNRSFISLVDGTNQHIIAEATKSVSLRNKDSHLPNDDIYLGVMSLDLKWGLCPHTIRLFTGEDPSYIIDTDNITASRTHYIIRDLSKEDCFKDRPYVLGWPHFRFYAEVPLKSPSGIILGTYCVIDDKPRERADFSEDDVDTLQEISDAIVHHLENVRVVNDHRRSERLVKGLTSFVKDYSDFDPREASSGRRLESTSLASNAEMPISLDGVTVTGASVVSASSASSRTEHTSTFFSPLPGSTEPSSLDSNLSVSMSSPGEERPMDDVQNTAGPGELKSTLDNASLVSLADSIPISDRITSIFARASVLLRDSMDLDGVAFLDAARCNPSFQVPIKHASWEPLPKSVSPVSPPLPVTPSLTPLGLSGSASEDLDTPCDFLSSAFGKALPGDAASIIHVTEELLTLLIAFFPQGQIFTSTDSAETEDYLSFGSVTASGFRAKKIQTISQQVLKLVPSADSVLFLPLWDYHKSRWMAGTLVWARDSHRVLGMEELHYFKVFGDSIVSEVSRVHWITTEKSKFDFISSVSHELRSPLHGILASAELLHATCLEPAQEDMIRMIETSGLTLLDTTDHLLEFCKINNLTQAKKSKGKRQRETSSLVSDFDLGHLVEEVTNILYTGQRAPRMTGRDIVRFSPGIDEAKSGGICAHDMSLVVRIEQSQSWIVRSLPGAWRRIVMNLLGNALKWTKSGFVEVSLSVAAPEKSHNFVAHLSITDTGSGIAPDFLRHKLFSPFAQEDSLTEGVGLGLSIVRQLVTSLHGTVSVRSELGIGTQVDVYIPVQDPDGSIPPQLMLKQNVGGVDGIDVPLQACLVAFNGYPDLNEVPTGVLSVDAKRKISIQSTLADVFMSQFGWSVSLAESLEQAQGDVVVFEEAVLEAAAQGSSCLKVIQAMEAKFKYIVILGSKSMQKTYAPTVIWITQPFGPHKVQTAVRRALELHQTSAQSEFVPTMTSLTISDDPFSTPSNSPPVEDEEETTPKAVVEKKPQGAPVVELPIQTTLQPKTKHVLIVDDNDINLKIMATFIRKIGCSYETATNGLIALEKYMASSQQFNFVLMDISMPVMDGLVSTSKIRQYEKEKRLRPSCIMAVTGVASESMQQQAQKAGINQYLIKPLSLHELKGLMAID
ncbi:hypothetical protein N7448_005967 [Penicillium atrosanguineum]|uniref:histidine kinase n=1 Tax=Penicillium atrosanguineum TaxID=1132637 RepID=A0A9W9PQT4_9EURO|nr:uncharacterized protein N7443_009730 [Penicillium atrosanguineum]KAJ5131809.1 hypothetical protein N7448_005967 [Penicillium atrosanguineum]KAJ5137986.1 hypothetical protein N7526_004219 [Penicillium atrosanguineum]KAJ5289477.1 hypothetical protein N7443_009730 [Penicillium atrosanguineum]KAJ5307292.1 hypothetical protein N7476_007948 [Penicillium atrosanguineum]